MTRRFTARADGRWNTCLIASGSGSAPASSNCIRARHGSCIARTSIGSAKTPLSSSRFSANVPPPQGGGEVWPRLRELLSGRQSRRPQGHAAENPGMASATEKRQEPGRLVGHVRSDPGEMAAISRPLPWIGAQVSMAEHEHVSDPLADAQAQEARGPQNKGRGEAQTTRAEPAERVRSLVTGIFA
jgi:hypothetical protein